MIKYAKGLISRRLAKVFATMHNDGVLDIISKDLVIVLFGNFMAQKHSRTPHRKGNISTRLRELGKLVQRLKTKNISTLEEALQPRNYYAVVEQALILGEWDEENELFGKPQLPKNLGHSINKYLELYNVHCIKNELDSTKQDKFVKLMKTQWGPDIQDNAISTLDTKTYNKTTQLPTMDDVQMLANYLLEEQLKLEALLLQEENKINRVSYRNLLETVLIFLLQFNRRRPGEVSRLTVAAYNAATAINEDDGASFSFPGKNNKKLGVIVPERQKQLLDLLLQHRGQVGIKSKNPYVFANWALNPLNPNHAFAKYASACGVKNANLLRATLLRKQLATHAAHDLELNENQTTNLAEFMGHTRDVHKKFYKMSGKALHLKKIQPVLQAMQGASGSSV